MSTHFTIKIPCKPYVRAYLETNCGSPADLKFLPDLLKEFKVCLDKKPCHRETANVACYSDIITIIIPPDWFYRYGWEMNKENILDFNQRVELKVKFFMRQYIAINQGFGTPLNICIRDFQDNFGFAEHIWPGDSIRKDFYRNGEACNIHTIKELRKELNKILLDNLSRAGTLSKKHKKENTYG